MSSPVYDGKGQPSVALGWFSGLASWWYGLTPEYVNHAYGGASAAPPSGGNSHVVTIGWPEAPTGAPGKPADSSASHATASGTAAKDAPVEKP